MKRYEALETLFGKVDLSFAETVLNESYHVRGRVAGRRGTRLASSRRICSDD
jgi:hypothetical protein